MNIVKAISLWQPWATLVAIGAKEYETRSWSTNYRGPLAIHAAKRWTREQRHLLMEEPFRLCLAGQQIPRGFIIATVELVEVLPTTELVDKISDKERAFGDWSPGRFAWRLENVRRLPEPVQATGRQGFWEWNDGNNLF